MNYQVPQFIEVEDKIFGPLTIKQFVYLAGAGGVSLAAVTLLPLSFAIFVSLPFVGLALALAFYKVNDRPFIFTIEHAFAYFLGSKLYLWKQLPPSVKKEQTSAVTTAPLVSVPSLSESRLKDLAWSLNIKNNRNAGIIDPERPRASQM